MSQITKRVCDNCRKETLDQYEELGWIQIRGHSITISKGRKPDKTADTRFIQLREGYGQEFDFCGIDCLVAFLKEEPAFKLPTCTLEADGHKLTFQLEQGYQLNQNRELIPMYEHDNPFCGIKGFTENPANRGTTVHLVGKLVK